jgi:hypothetical protein
VERFLNQREVIMHSKLLAIAIAGIVMMTGAPAWAQSSTAEKTPGHIMQRTTVSTHTPLGYRKNCS